ncbi:alpha/beta fold hydrolase [Deinococcus yavapaiensis]|uniref:Pimeloyl-ACP methyl ester carboxylesterase n=1 Tax=Deinococcus yavapaiensis KR-236 TaxID=694435 RepID=A0A318S0E4_9DEIO|nr:alpha/beta fold hydrolase [Deinococcus yavapaiensis]PYE48657.1 pimeloyl-ACP methyl ester carboxylesterase [Deinococcus yavapaiensis KR-236]
MNQPEFLNVGQVRTRHVTQGEGEPVVLLHGIGRSLEDWADTVPAFAAHHRVYALDLIGFGLTDKPDVPYTLPGLARFVRHYLDAVGETRPVHLVGNSMGGAVAQQFAAMYPQQVRKLVLVNSAGFGREVTFVLRLLAVPKLGEWLMAPNPRNSARAVQGLFHDSRFATAERRRHAQLLARQPNRARSYLSVARFLGGWRGVHPHWREALTRQVAERKLATLIIWGDRDKILPAKHLEHARRVYPHARSHLFPQTGHMPQIERAGEFNALVLKFLGE